MLRMSKSVSVNVYNGIVTDSLYIKIDKYVPTENTSYIEHLFIIPVESFIDEIENGKQLLNEVENMTININLRYLHHCLSNEKIFSDYYNKIFNIIKFGMGENNIGVFGIPCMNTDRRYIGIPTCYLGDNKYVKIKRNEIFLND